eukprot:TRINITY_DN63155_c0_g1_i1.p1 TRINITY_DN63155_c0_g1~~TRINITY_DN63155_c0_g1_i1.p1  ORF type:complete len:540 (+),score=58.66 TRINITY_DN63155_c0_g1_i1:56-1675(+)
MLGITRYSSLLLVILPFTAAGRVVELEDGLVEGRAEGKVGVWLGIPYAAPPVGDLRWRPPQAPRPWRPATLRATGFQHSCYQQTDMGYRQPLSTQNEDCLYLNVYAPLQQPSRPLPVMFWIHGGGFQGGGGNETRLNGTWDVELTSGNIIIVTLNYRLSVFGFAASDQLRSRDPDGGTGNYGILDQRLALHWVQANIAAFGGDKSRVFIVGQSAGAKSVSQHLVRRKSWGLFHAAGMESGAFYDNWPSRRGQTVKDREGAFVEMMRNANCSTLTCLLHLPAVSLIQFSLPGTWHPVVDGVDLVGDDESLAEQGRLYPVPIIVGSTMEDGSFDTPPRDCRPSSCSEADFRNWLKRIGMGINEIDWGIMLYSNDTARPADSNHTEWYWALKHAGADSWATCPALRTARQFTQIGQRAYVYYWSYVPKGVNGEGWAHHSVEQPFVFHVLSETQSEIVDDGGQGGKYHIDTSEAGFSASVVKYWVTFAATTHPEGWPPHGPDGSVLLLGDNMTISLVTGHPRRKQCEFWDYVKSRLKAKMVII